MPPIRAGRTATASCSPPATARCCSMRCSISPATRSMTLDEIKNFRQLHSQDAGSSGELHDRPASRRPPGRSARASPPRSAWRWPSACWRREFGDDLVDHHTYVLCSDGDLMEGVSQEAIALAGHLRLVEADLPLRRQRHFHRRAAVARRQRRPGEALRGGRLARRAHRRPRSRRRRGGHRGGAEVRPSDAHRLQDDHRLRRAHEGRHRQGAWRAARRRRAHRRQGRARLAARAVQRAGGHALAAWRAIGERQRGEREAWQRRARRQAGGQARRVRPPRAARCPGRADARHRQAETEARGRAADGRHPQGERDGPRGRHRGGAGAGARLRRSDAVQQHQDQEPGR